MEIDTDYLVIGSGLAGLTFALTAAQHGTVTVLTKRAPEDANSSWAQGGIAGVMGSDDTLELHTQDTLVAGAGLCHPDAVNVLVTEGPQRIRDLMELGANFNTTVSTEGEEVLALGREGGHSRNRIVHTADYTGLECEQTLLHAVQVNANINVLEHLFVTDLIIHEIDGVRRCTGVYALGNTVGDRVKVEAKATLLATGGCGQVYQYTTNPAVATGDGVAMAWRAGAPIANMEFIQFHPTTLHHEKARAFLITEALRGEGGILRHADGEAFMAKYHPLKDLAPRDIVARAIVSEMKLRNVECVYLDATHISSEVLAGHFPTISQKCAEVGIDITRDPIPIVPAQHYQCGGVVTGLDAETEIYGLYAAGEVACTGVHGANRLASNSLLEAMVFGRRAALHAVKHCPGNTPDKSVTENTTMADLQIMPDEEAAATHQCVQRIMNRSAGIVRSTSDMEAALRKVESCLDSFTGRQLSTTAWEARNAVTVATLILKSALARHESRGLHYTVDFPERSGSEPQDTVLVPVSAC